MKIIVGMASCGLASGAGSVYHAIESSLKEAGNGISLGKTGCVGLCQKEPLVDVVLDDGSRVTYGQMDPNKTKALVSSLAKGKVPEEGVLWTEISEYPFFKKQKKIALRNCGFIDPENIDEYIAKGGYEALKKVLKEMKPEDVIREIKASGLRGRGGAGFTTGKKWEIARSQPSREKYIICNADEGDPGAFMDRSILESDPHSVLEGMMIGAYAIGANTAYIYIRSEYPLAITRVETAIKQARGHGFDSDIKIRKGQGAFVCGEETALISSIVTGIGEPNPRPPYPAVSGLFGMPTVINNVKTWANIAPIIMHGSSWFSSIGTQNSKGTAVFSLVGKVNNTGLVEVSMGMTLREMIYDVGGGIPGGKRFKAVQTGGPSGGCIPESQIDLGLDYEQLTAAGSMMGSGGMIVVDSDTCMVDLARFFLTFTTDESCGKCTPCREGTRRMLEILTDIVDGKGRPGDIELLKDMAGVVKETSLCGLGKTAPNPVLTTLRYFPEEFKAHLEKKCPAKVCRALIHYKITAEKCTGCMLCTKECPVKVIVGELKGPQRIIEEKCIKCGACKDVCKFDAVCIE